MSANKEFMKQFFATKSTQPKVIHVGGTFKFENLPQNMQAAIKDRLAEKDPVVKELSEKKAVGIIIDGKEVTQKWADQLDLEKPDIPRDDGIDIKKLIKVREESLKEKKPDTESKLEDIIKPEEPKPKIGHAKKELEEKAKELGFNKFRDWAKKNYKVTGRDINGIIKDILFGKKELN